MFIFTLNEEKFTVPQRANCKRLDIAFFFFFLQNQQVAELQSQEGWDRHRLERRY